MRNSNLVCWPIRVSILKFRPIRIHYKLCGKEYWFCSSGFGSTLLIAALWPLLFVFGAFQKILHRPLSSAPSPNWKIRLIFILAWVLSMVTVIFKVSKSLWHEFILLTIIISRFVCVCSVLSSFYFRIKTWFICLCFSKVSDSCDEYFSALIMFSFLRLSKGRFLRMTPWQSANFGISSRKI